VELNCTTGGFVVGVVVIVQVPRRSAGTEQASEADPAIPEDELISSK
jgi:hypothetical protein